jgi:hypothetical protein
MLIALELISLRMIFRSSNVGSPVTFGRLECGYPMISSSGVDTIVVVVRRDGVAPCCKSITYL